MTNILREFNERMELVTSQGTHSQFMDSLSPGEARAYIEAFDRWLVRINPEATDQDFYWRSILTSSFFPDRRQEKADLKRAVALNPHNVDIWVSLGHMAAEQKRWNEAIEYYESGIKTSPRNFFPWYGRALVYMKLRHFEESLRDIDIAIEIHPDLAYGYETRGQIYYRMGELDSAMADLDFALQCSAAGPTTHQLRNEVWRKLQRRKRNG
jgi:tetratricopeptide (TPR) repeat protein